MWPVTYSDAPFQRRAESLAGDEKHACIFQYPFHKFISVLINLHEGVQPSLRNKAGHSKVLVYCLHGHICRSFVCRPAVIQILFQRAVLQCLLQIFCHSHLMERVGAEYGALLGSFHAVNDIWMRLDPSKPPPQPPAPL